MRTRGGFLGCLFVSVVFYGVAGQVASICRANENLLVCGGCQKTCENPVPECAGACRSDCFCPEDLVRNATGHCVPLSECPTMTVKLESSEPRPKDCAENEEYRFCEPCNKTCDNPNPICPAQCARGCFCIDGLLRDKNGKCVELAKCRTVKAELELVQSMLDGLKCGSHQVFKSCETCERICSNHQLPCEKTSCQAGCFCEDGYFKAPNSQCVKLKDCPKAEVSIGVDHELAIEDCASDEVFLSCGWCEPSCWDPKPQCPLGVCTRGCLCRPPLLRHHDGRCVEEEACSPQKCTNPNEDFICRYGCEARCDQTCVKRLRRCTLGCHCKLGLLRDGNGQCVTLQNCTSKPTVAVFYRNKFYKYFGENNAITLNSTQNFTFSNI